MIDWWWLFAAIIFWAVSGVTGIRRYLSGSFSLSPRFERLLFISSGPFGWIILFRFWKRSYQLKQFSKAPPSS